MWPGRPYNVGAPRQLASLHGQSGFKRECLNTKDWTPLITWAVLRSHCGRKHVGWEILSWPPLDNTIAIVYPFATFHIPPMSKIHAKQSDPLLGDLYFTFLYDSAQNPVCHHLNQVQIQIRFLGDEFLGMIPLLKTFEETSYMPPR